MEPERRPPRLSPIKMGRGAETAWEAALSVVVGVVLGIFVDKWTGLSPIFTFVFLLLGVVNAFRRLIALAKSNAPPP
ncbi:MAG: AtpZ/AtpI family protein [Myxococcota bacterium]